jgi:CO/xanthine dehydrogenase Mo-binding subunit
VDAYRGAGRPEATFVLERLVDVAAIEMGIDKAEIRRRNMIPIDAYPYQTPVMMKYDSGDPVGASNERWLPRTGPDSPSAKLSPRNAENSAE